MILLYFITPLLGSLRNYVKYKKLNFLLFIRTPITYFFLSNLFRCNNVWQTLIYERWFFFIYKTWISIYNDDYNTKRDKYIKKYGLKYKK